MKNNVKMAATLLLLAPVLCFPILGRQEKPAAPSGGKSAAQPADKNSRQAAGKDAAQAARPGAAEMERLKFYLGEWAYTETYPKSSFAPNGGKNTGLYSSRLGPGGNSLINTFHSQGPVGDFAGMLVATWDLKEKAYKAYVFIGDGPGAVVETGRFENDALVFRFEFPAGDKILRLRNVTRLVAPDKIVSEEFMATSDGPESLLVHAEATKRK